MKRAFVLLGVAVVAGALIFGARFLVSGNTFEIMGAKDGETAKEEKRGAAEKKTEGTPRQKPLPNPPKIIRAVYLTAWSGGSPKVIDAVIARAKGSEINAVVIDVKDHTGVISWDEQIKDINGVIKKFHDAGIYVIARITVFQDPVLTERRPDLAIHDARKISSSTPISVETRWLDNKKAGWLDPAAREAWDYVIGIAKDAAGRGFDELNFDYIRFPSDAGLEYTRFLTWDENTRREYAMREFFKYLREALPDIKISADVFGQTTVTYNNDMGIGQIIEDSYAYFDVVSPMLYPSHYVKNFIGLENAAASPYEVVKFSMEEAKRRLEAMGTSTTATIRPWLQDFDLKGVAYTPEMVRAQIKATRDAMGTAYTGYYLWDPENTYTWEALKKEVVQ